MKNHLHLAELYTIYKSESQPFRKVHRMIDLFESIIKTHTVVILGEYFKQNKYSNAAKGLLASGLRTPSLGTWQLFSRVLYKELSAENHVFFQVDFAKEFEKLDKDLDNQKTNVISFRNEYAHGATPSDELCSEDIKRFEPFLESLLASKWLADSTLLELEGKVYISNSSTADVISLYPILLYKPEPNAQPYVFFNDLKNDKVGLLNYPLSKHYREKDFFQEFNTYLPLKEWKNTGSSEFHQRIEELTETFKGRTQERLRIKEFIEKKDKGYFSIQGNPGIGKSALIAQLFKDLSNQTPKLPIKLVEYFIRRGTAQANSTYLLNYLLKATDTHFSEGKNIQAEGKTNWDLQQQLFAKWRTYGDANPKEKLVFFIDGLDEGIENDILRYLPRENFKDIIVIYGSRPGGHKDIEAFWIELPVEYHQSLLLTGLSKNDIRALLYEVGNKYEIEKNSAWIDTVEKRSEGNPLYLKLLCNAIENGSIPYNDPKALPTEINDYYKAILTRYANDSLDGDALLSSLFVFAAAVDYLTPVHLQLINGFGTAQSIRIESTLKEVLYENPLTEEVLDYQLFHESFREFLVQFYPTELKRAEEKLLEFCSTWNTLQHTFEQRYALQHYTSHLTQNSSEQSILTLINLSKNKAYTDTQKKVLRGFNATKQLYQDIIHHTIKLASTDDALEAALALVDLKYEEQNDAESILAMVANNEIDLALLRITAFGGERKEDKQRQFILYMLCLMELTLLESKTQPWCKSAIEKLLAQFEEQIPVDHSLVNWDDFFPSYLVFLMAYELTKLGMDYLMVYQRTDYWKVDWIQENGPFCDMQFEVLLKCARGISDDYKNFAIATISSELAKQGKLAEALSCARDISENGLMSSSLAAISSEMSKQGRDKEAASTMQEALACALGISDDFYKFGALVAISSELARQGKIEEALDCARGISSDGPKSSAIAAISIELAKQGQLKKALVCARGISDEYYKSPALQSIVNELAKNGKIEEAFVCAREISDESNKISALMSISNELAKQGKIEVAASTMQEALACARSTSNDYWKSIYLKDISSELASQGNIEEATSTIQESLIWARNDESYKWSLLKDISTELAKQGNNHEAAYIMQEALKYALEISNDYWKSSYVKDIINELAKQGKFKEATSALQEALTCNSGSHEYSKSRALKDISSELTKQGKAEDAAYAMQETLEFARFVSDELDKISTLKEISNELNKQGKIEESASAMLEALECARGIGAQFYSKSWTLRQISGELGKLGKIEDAASAMQEVLKCNQDGHKYWFGSTQKDISTILAQHENIIESILFARDINYDRAKSMALMDISTALAQQGNQEKAVSMMYESLACARGISDDYDKSMALKAISTELAKQGNLTLAESTSMEIQLTIERHSCWKEIAKVTLEKHDALTSLKYYSEFKNEEAQTFYLKGWAEHVSIQSISNEVFCEALPLLAKDTVALEQFLQTYAIQVLFFENPSQAKLQVLNQTLNFQWALDVKSQLPQPQTATRLSTNHDTWLHEIEDEDDQDQITLWAKQVAKGKITEEEFKAKIKSL